LALIALVSFSLLLSPVAADGTVVRIKDITTVEGERINQLTGMGLVTGLAGTGGRTPATRLFALNLLQKFGQRFDPILVAGLRNDAKDRTDNLSVVTVLADLPPGRRKGEQIDVIVSAFDDAKSLQGGTLIFTPLQAVNGEVYAVAQGPLAVGGFSFSGDAAQAQKNHPTTGRISNGATVEEETCSTVGRDGKFRLLLQRPDYETARRIAEAINAKYPEAAVQLGPNAVEIKIPVDFQLNTDGFLGLIGELKVVPDERALVIINERTGTVIIGENVKLSRVLITHANLAIMTSETPEASQPLPFSDGETVVLPRTQLDVFEDPGLPVTMIDEQATVGDLAQALNALGVTPRDLSSIFQMLKESGSLHAELQIK
jgi:flagellar P-ring protein precursor FlgI